MAYRIWSLNVDKAETIQLMHLIRSWLPPGWGAGWQELVVKVSESEPSEHDRILFNFIDTRCSECPHCQTKFTARCRACTMKWCSRCTPTTGRCEGCDDEASDAIDEALGNEAESAIGWAGRKSKKLTDGSRAVNMHNLSLIHI